MANAYSIRVMVDVKKLLFLGRLCRLRDIMAKWAFMERLFPTYPAARTVGKTPRILSPIFYRSHQVIGSNYIEEFHSHVKSTGQILCVKL